MAITFPALGGQQISPVQSSQPADAVQQQLAQKYGPPPVRTESGPIPKPADKNDTSHPIIKALIGAPATMLVRPIQAGAMLAGVDEDTIDKKTKDWSGGIVSPIPRDFGEVKKDLGRAVQTVAFGMGPVSGGAAFGAGVSVEQGNNVVSTETAFNVALGSAAGKTLALVGKPLFNVAGKVVGKVTPEFLKDIAGKGTKAIQEFAEHHDILPESVSKAISTGVDKAEQIANKPFDLLAKGAKAPVDAVRVGLEKKRAEALPGVIDDLEQSYKDIATGRISTRKAMTRSEKATEAKNRAGTEGRTPQRVLAESGVVPEHDNRTFTTHAQAEQMRGDIDSLSRANQNALVEVEQQTQPISTGKLFERTKNRIMADKSITDSDKKIMIKNAAEDLAGLGESVVITRLDGEKSAQWGKVKFDTAVPKFKRDYHYQMAKSMQEEIEETAKLAGLDDVAQLNREIGDQLEAIKFLEGLDGRKVIDGQIGKHFARLTGGMIGASAGGPLGAMFGALGGEVVSRMLASNSIASPVNRWLIKDLQARDPEAYVKVIEWIKQQSFDKEGRLMISEGAIPMGTSAGENIEPNVFFNDFKQNSNILNNTKQLPAPEERIITPNTQGTPNQPGVPYSPSTVDGVGGMRQRLPAGNEKSSVVDELSRQTENSLANKMTGSREKSLEYFRENPSEITKESIKVREVDGKLVIEDGRHRLQIAKELGIEPKIEDVTVVYTGKPSTLLSDLLKKAQGGQRQTSKQSTRKSQTV